MPNYVSPNQDTFIRFLLQIWQKSLTPSHPHSCDIAVVVLAAAVAAASATVPPGVGMLVEPDLVLELVVGERVLRLLRQRVTGDRLQVRITFT